MFIASVSMAATAHAQPPATAFAELPSRLSIGETVFVTNHSGKTVKGKVQQVSDTILVLRSGPDDVTLAAPDVQRVARRGHTLRKGALIGLAAGFITGATLAASSGCGVVCFASPGGVLIWGGFVGAIGLGAGAVVGASLRREIVVFERAPTGRAQAMVTPLPRRGGAGLRVQIRW